jgi:hypothetical protein
VRQNVSVFFFLETGDFCQKPAMLFRRHILRLGFRRQRWDFERQTKIDLINQIDRLAGGKNITRHRSVHGKSLGF